MHRVLMSLSVLLLVAVFTNTALAEELESTALESALRGYRECLADQEALQAVRDPLCVALVLADPSMCRRTPSAVAPTCRLLAGVRRWTGLLLLPFQLIPRGHDPLATACPVALPPGAVVDDTPCRRLLLSHVLLPNGGEGATVTVKMVNPFDQAARCALRLRARHQHEAPEDHDEELVVAPRSPLDRRIPIRYDAGTRVEVEVACTWSP